VRPSCFTIGIERVEAKKPTELLADHYLSYRRQGAGLKGDIVGVVQHGHEIAEQGGDGKI